ncbi:MAG: hypothetical protein JXR23_07410, partial [Pontiellaceae bacterium]|nr:hypothetical protein [Pontiellaceae bacterium]
MMKTTLALSATLLLLAGTATADEASAQRLARRLPSAVSGDKIHPIWAPDDSALYIHEAEQIIKIDTAAGAESPMFDFEKVAEHTGFRSPRIERFSVAENGGFFCLVSSGDQYTTLR